ncbi:MAG TPA: hypothetical protein VFB65_10220 [Pyrinomonadaceae bacterium]|nr:hypothetical protein [Pyrinomonadaceae bacterium]
MTPEQHNKYLAYSNLAYGGLFVLLALLMMVFILGILGAAPNGPPVGLMIFFSLFALVIYGGMVIPSFVAAYGLLKRKKWARTASIVAAVVAAANFPIGTAVCVYTFWFLFSDPGKYLFDQNNHNYALPPGQQTWANQTWQHDAQRQRENQYQAPPSPPDWR